MWARKVRGCTLLVPSCAIRRSTTLMFTYVQVAMTIMGSRETGDREYRSFEKIKDNYPKYLLTRNDPIQKREGIIHANIPEFMIENERFE